MLLFEIWEVSVLLLILSLQLHEFGDYSYKCYWVKVRFIRNDDDDGMSNTKIA